MDFKTYVSAAAAWVAVHPALAIMLFLAFMNVLMAQIPKPKSAAGLAVYNLINKSLLIIATHKDDPGTFTLPWLIKIFMDQAEKTAPVSIASPPAPPAPTPPLVDPKSPPASKEDGEDHGS